VRADGIGGDGDAFQHQVGIALHEIAVLEGAGLALVGVAEQVDGMAGYRMQEAPLAAGREAGAAPAAQARGRHLRDDVLGAHGERLLQGPISAA